MQIQHYFFALSNVKILTFAIFVGTSEISDAQPLPEELCGTVAEIEPNGRYVFDEETVSGLVAYQSVSHFGAVTEGRIVRLWANKDGFISAISGDQSDTILKDLSAPSVFSFEYEYLDVGNANFEFRITSGSAGARICFCSRTAVEAPWDEFLDQNIENRDITTLIDLSEYSSRHKACVAAVREIL